MEQAHPTVGCALTLTLTKIETPSHKICFEKSWEKMREEFSGSSKYADRLKSGNWLLLTKTDPNSPARRRPSQVTHSRIDGVFWSKFEPFLRRILRLNQCASPSNRQSRLSCICLIPRPSRTRSRREVHNQQAVNRACRPSRFL